MFQMKEQDKASGGEKSLIEMEISNLPDKR